MAKYNPGDDGKTIGGRIVVFVWPPGDAPAATSSAPGPGQPGSDKNGNGATSGSSGSDAGASGTGAANAARASISPDGGLAARNNTLQDQNAAAGKQAETLAEAAKAAVPFCEKCAASDAEHETEAPAAA